ncbi:MAG: M56 family metallopeptidase, partial [Eubacteriales bacterium]|nr:M56 family metallopeptidase [Eubacteriales bacterium]
MTAAARAAAETALWSSVLIGLLLVLRRAAAGRLEPACFRAAWVLLAARMALPCSFVLSFAPLQAQLPLQAQAVAGQTRYRLLLSDAAAAAGGAQAARGGWDITMPLRMLPWIWLAGCCCFLIWHLVSYGIWLRKVRSTAAPERSEPILQQARTALGGRVAVWRMAQPGSPMVAGLVRPALYLPRNFPERDLPYILAHEAQHLRRHDLALQLLLCAAGAVQWFNPLAYVMRRAALCDLELACDAAALRGRNLSYRRAYGFAVLHVLAGTRKDTLLASRFSGTSASLKARFEEMLRETKKRKGTWLPVLLAAVIGAASLLVGCGASMPTA